MRCMRCALMRCTDQVRGARSKRGCMSFSAAPPPLAYFFFLPQARRAIAARRLSQQRCRCQRLWGHPALWPSPQGSKEMGSCEVKRHLQSCKQPQGPCHPACCPCPTNREGCLGCRVYTVLRYHLHPAHAPGCIYIYKP